LNIPLPEQDDMDISTFTNILEEALLFCQKSNVSVDAIIRTELIANAGFWCCPTISKLTVAVLEVTSVTEVKEIDGFLDAGYWSSTFF